MIRIGGLTLRPGMPRVAVPLFRKLTPDAFRALRDSGMDIAEIRLDMSGAQTPREAAELTGAFAGAGVPLIATARSALEGGRWTGDEKSRRDVLLAALEFADAADVELSSGDALPEVVSAARKGGKVAIVSRHNFSGMDSRDEMERALAGARKAARGHFQSCVPCGERGGLGNHFGFCSGALRQLPPDGDGDGGE